MIRGVVLIYLRLRVVRRCTATQLNGTRVAFIQSFQFLQSFSPRTYAEVQ